MELTTIHRRPRALLIVASRALSMACLLVAVWFLMGTEDWLPFMFGMSSALGFLPMWLEKHPRERHDRVAATSSALRVGNKVIARDRIRTAMLVKDQRTWVSVRGRWPLDVDVAVADEQEAGQLLEALGFDASNSEITASRLPIEGGVMLAFLTPLLASIIALLTIHPGAGWSGLTVDVLQQVLTAVARGFVIAVVVSWPLLLMSTTTRVRLGTDGVLVRQGVRRPAFVPYDDVMVAALVERIGFTKTVEIRRKHGKPIRFSLASTEAAHAFIAQLEHARQAHAARDATASAGSLARGERSVSEWISWLRRVGSGDAATFRRALPTEEMLLAVVESATTSVRDRLAALVALRAKLPADEPRLRIAVEHCALPEVRVRLEQVLEAASDSEMEAALEAASD